MGVAEFLNVLCYLKDKARKERADYEAMKRNYTKR